MTFIPIRQIMESGEPTPHVERISFSSCIDGEILMITRKGSDSDREVSERIENLISTSLKTLLKDNLFNVVIDNTVVIERK